MTPDGNNIDRIQNVKPVSPAEKPDVAKRPARTEEGKTFSDVLRSKVAEQLTPQRPAADQAAGTVAEPTIKWSAHAEARLRQRGIIIGPAEQARVEAAVDRAAGKGSREALVLMDDVAMVVSVKNRTVITAIGQDQAKENVFTNIDSAVFA